MNYWKRRKVLVTGAGGFLGRHVVAELQTRGATFRALEGKVDCDLRDTGDTEVEFRTYKPDVVIHLAAVVGGIGANRERPADFFIDNALMGASILSACRNHRVEKLVLLGTTCSYPKYPAVPFHERELWNGYPEETNAPYGVAKRALMVGAEALSKQYGIKVANLIPTNMYGPGDHYDLETSHVIPAMIRKMHEAKASQVVELWGTGQPTRDFLYVKDAAQAIVTACEVVEDGKPINLGSGQEVSMRALSEAVASAVGFGGLVVWNSDKPDGQPRRALDSSRAAEVLNWKATTSLKAGLEATYEDYVQSLSYTKS